MEKVKLTQEQAESLEYLKRNFRSKEIVILHVQKYGCDWAGKVEGINGLDVDTLIKALYIGYEIEEPFKVGDWVVFKSGLISKITKTDISHRKEQLIQVDNIEPGEDADDEYIPVSHVVRKAIAEEIAAEKERRKWKSIGREVNDYHKGDIVMVKNYADVVEFVDSIGPYLRGLKRYVGLNEIELICPVEQRFDVKDDTE
jgi:hypothetical protein